MDGGSPSRYQEKRSKKNQDRAAVPKPPGRTKASYQRGGAGGSRATRRRVDQGSSAAAPPPTPAPPPAPAPIGAEPMVDEEEEAPDHAGRTLTVPPLRTPPRGPPGMFQLVPFTGVSPIMRAPTMALNPADGWTPPLLVDYRHRVKDI